MTLETIVWEDYPKGGKHTVVGTVKICRGFWSPQLGNGRDVLVHLPSSYTQDTRRYQVLYMHDGQNLFDRDTAFAGQDWQVDETLEKLSREGLEAIVVGLNNIGDQRLKEYNPFANFHNGRGELYLDFIINTVKPAIDRDFRTLPGQAHTGIMGSSMGGLISLYAFLRYPEVFSFVGAMSPSFWFAKGAIYDYVAGAAMNPGKVYLDNGTRENSARQMYKHLSQKGYRVDQNLLYIVDEGAGHEEAAWAGRLPGALRFLLHP
ncbi:MAG: alpha/beta hydrolase [Chloroflexi bacterium]|nr:alpha/beta hydrolase [Chloroflexota bacterium]